MVDVDTLLYELENNIRSAKIEGSFMARVMFGAGMQEAASMIERKRIQILCEGIVGNVPEVVREGSTGEATDG